MPETEKERAEALKRHLNSVRNHYNELVHAKLSKSRGNGIT